MVSTLSIREPKSMIAVMLIHFLGIARSSKNQKIYDISQAMRIYNENFYRHNRFTHNYIFYFSKDDKSSKKYEKLVLNSLYSAKDISDDIYKSMIIELDKNVMGNKIFLYDSIARAFDKFYPLRHALIEVVYEEKSSDGFSTLFTTTYELTTLTNFLDQSTLSQDPDRVRIKIVWKAEVQKTDIYLLSRLLSIYYARHKSNSVFVFCVNELSVLQKKVEVLESDKKKALLSVLDIYTFIYRKSKTPLHMYTSENTHVEEKTYLQYYIAKKLYNPSCESKHELNSLTLEYKHNKKHQEYIYRGLFFSINLVFFTGSNPTVRELQCNKRNPFERLNIANCVILYIYNNHNNEVAYIVLHPDKKLKVYYADTFANMHAKNNTCSMDPKVLKESLHALPCDLDLFIQSPINLDQICYKPLLFYSKTYRVKTVIASKDNFMLRPLQNLPYLCQVIFLEHNPRYLFKFFVLKKTAYDIKKLELIQINEHDFYSLYQSWLANRRLHIVINLYTSNTRCLCNQIHFKYKSDGLNETECIASAVSLNFDLRKLSLVYNKENSSRHKGQTFNDRNNKISSFVC